MRLDGETLEDLLLMEEGDALDFKQEQYRFSNASDRDKSELLKDVLAFANTQRVRTAYILVGVEEVKDGRSRPVGVDEHLDDAGLHQFVNAKTNRSIDFNYSANAIEGKSIGVIAIPIQQRPFWVQRDYAVVKANQVYIRDGSSTRPALPDEIVAMGRRNPPMLQVEWVNAKARAVYPTNYVHKNTGLKLPDQFHSWTDSGGQYDFAALARRLGADPAIYDGDIFTRIRRSAMYDHLGLRFHNSSGSVGENVKFTGTLKTSRNVRFRQLEYHPRLHNDRRLDQIEDKKMQFAHGEDRIDIDVEIGHIRPGEYIWAGRRVQFSTKESGTLVWEVRFVADNLPEPIECLLPLQIEYIEREIQLEDLQFSSNYVPDWQWAP